MSTSYKELTIYTQSHQPSERLDKLLSSHPEIKTRSRAQKLIEKNLVTVNSKPAKASQKIDVKDTVIVKIPVVDTSDEIKPFKINLDIIHEDDDILVINKPAGLVVHPAHGHEQDTLVNAIVDKVQGLSMGFAEKRPGIVHRLDKETSGLMVIAKNDVAHLNLSKQFKDKTAKRYYWAIVHGKFKEDKKTVESYLIRHPKDRKRFCSDKLKTGKFAKTHITKKATFLQNISWIECELETGRTHQIRVHATELSHPLLGDIKYGADKRDKRLPSSDLRKLVQNMNRIALHAFKLEITHPITEKQMVFESDWPPELKELLQLLKES